MHCKESKMLENGLGSNVLERKEAIPMPEIIVKDTCPDLRVM